MRSNRIPSYLLKSFSGIYYFRVRVPKKIQLQYNVQVTEVKKSLKTRDYSEAVRYARRLLVLMELTDFMMKNIEFEIAEDNEGKKLLKNLLMEQIKCSEDGYFRDYDQESPVDEYINKLSEEGRRLLDLQLEKWNKLSINEREDHLNVLKKEIGTGIVHLDESLNISNDINKSENSLISIIIAEYLDYYFEKKSMSGNGFPEATKDEYRGIYNEFISIVGENKKCFELNKQLLKKYETNLWRLPANYLGSFLNRVGKSSSSPHV